MTLALRPPKPKELDSARRTVRSWATWGVRSMSAQLGEGLSKLRVGGTTLSRIARIDKIASTAPAAPSRWPMAALVDAMETAFTASPNNRRPAHTAHSSPRRVDVPFALLSTNMLASSPAHFRAHLPTPNTLGPSTRGWVLW